MSAFRYSRAVNCPHSLFGASLVLSGLEAQQFGAGDIPVWRLCDWESGNRVLVRDQRGKRLETAEVTAEAHVLEKYCPLEVLASRSTIPKKYHPQDPLYLREAGSFQTSYYAPFIIINVKYYASSFFPVLLDTSITLKATWLSANILSPERFHRTSLPHKNA